MQTDISSTPADLGSIRHALDQVGCGAYWLAMADHHDWVDRAAVEQVGQRAVVYAVQVINVTSDQLLDALAYGRHCALTGRTPLAARSHPRAWMDSVVTPGVKG